MPSLPPGVPPSSASCLWVSLPHQALREVRDRQLGFRHYHDLIVQMSKSVLDEDGESCQQMPDKPLTSNDSRRRKRSTSPPRGSPRFANGTAPPQYPDWRMSLFSAASGGSGGGGYGDSGWSFLDRESTYGDHDRRENARNDNDGIFINGGSNSRLGRKPSMTEVRDRVAAAAANLSRGSSNSYHHNNYTGAAGSTMSTPFTAAAAAPAPSRSYRFGESGGGSGASQLSHRRATRHSVAPASLSLSIPPPKPSRRWMGMHSDDHPQENDRTRRRRPGSGGESSSSNSSNRGGSYGPAQKSARSNVGHEYDPPQVSSEDSAPTASGRSGKDDRPFAEEIKGDPRHRGTAATAAERGRATRRKTPSHSPTRRTQRRMTTRSSPTESPPPSGSDGRKKESARRGLNSGGGSGRDAQSLSLPVMSNGSDPSGRTGSVGSSPEILRVLREAVGRGSEGGRSSGVRHRFDREP